MYERLLGETERYLERRREIVVPVKQVWAAMIKEGRTGSFAVPSLMADFECLLEGDKRFEFVVEKNASRAVIPQGENFFEHEEMEKLGFSEDQKVKLRRIPLSPADDEETGDALDAAISLEDLDKEIEDQSLLDTAVVHHAPPKISATKPRSEKRKASSKILRGRRKSAATKQPKKIATKKSPSKKRKK